MKTALTTLVLLSLYVGRVGAAQLPSAVVTDGLGVNIHFTWANPDTLQELDMIQAAGCNVVSAEIDWAWAEVTKGKYDFYAPKDALYDACAARGIRVVYLLTGGNSLYGTDPTSAAWQQGFTNFAAAAAAQYKGDGVIWQVWSEPDGGMGMSGMTDPNTYMALAKQAIPAIRQADPNSTIVAPGCWVGASSYEKACFQQGLLNLVDAFGVDPFQTGNPEGVVAQYTSVRNLMQTYGGKTLPIVSSSWGYSTVPLSGGCYVSTPQLQGDYLARSFLVNLSQGIPLSSWYDWKNDGTDPANYEQNFGTVTQDLVAKPAYQEMQLLISSLKGETFTKKLSDGHTSDWLLVFTAPNGQQTLAAWTTSSGGRMNAVVPGWGTYNLTSTPFYVNPSTVPEPGTLVLVAAAAFGLAAYGLCGVGGSRPTGNSLSLFETDNGRPRSDRNIRQRSEFLLEKESFMFRIGEFLSVAVILLAGTSAGRTAPVLQDLTTGATIFDDDFEIGTVGLVPWATDPAVGIWDVYNRSDVPGTLAIQNATSAGFAAYSGNQFAEMTRGSSAPAYTLTGDGVAGNSGSGDWVRLTMPVRADAGEFSIIPQHDGTDMGDIGLFANYGGHVNQIAVCNDTAWQYSTAQSLTPSAWNLLTIDHQNGTNQYAISLNGHTPQTFTSYATTGLPLATWNGIKLENDAVNSVAYFDSANVTTHVPNTVLGLPSAKVSDGLGVNIHFRGNAAQDLDMIQAAGCKFVRMDAAWNQIETTAGHYDFVSNGTDALYNACAARGIRVLWNLDYGNPDLYGTDATSAAWQQGFTNFCTAMVTHFKGGSNIYELWNEPNAGGGGVPGLANASTYMTVANKVLPAIRKADPSSTIVGPACSWMDSNWLGTCFQKGLLNLVDAVSVHEYQQGSPEAVVSDYTHLRTLIQQYHPSGTVPIVSTEWGYSTAPNTPPWNYSVATPQLQGDYLARSFLVNLSQGIPLSIWYDWKNDGTDPTAYEQNFGTVTADLVPKPAYNEMQLLTRSLQGETFNNRLSSNSQDWLLVFTSPSGQQTLAAWTTRSSPYDVTVPGWGTLHLTSTPFYVNPVPEPSSLVLVAAAAFGLAAYGLWRKRR